MNAVFLTAGMGIAALSGAWFFSIPAQTPPVKSVSNCAVVIKSEDIRYVPLNPVAWEKGDLQKFIIKTEAALPEAKVETPRAKASAAPKTKTVQCRRGEREWYYNATKKRKMYKIRKTC